MGRSLSSAMRSIRLRGSDCALPLTHDVHHGLNGKCVNSCFIFSDSEGSHGTGIGSAPASTGILSSCTGSSTTVWMIASETVEFFSVCNPSTCTHEFCIRTHGFGNSPPRKHDFCEFCESSARTHDSIVPLTL